MGGSWRGLELVPARVGRSAVTIGNFDGVHLGHAAILRSAVEAGRARSVASVALTFDPHPLAVVDPRRAPQALTSIEHRIELIRAHGIDWVAVLPFDERLAGLSPQAFAETVLAAKLAAQYVVVGPGFRFGRAQAGDEAALRALGQRLGFQVGVADTVQADGEAVSSTRVRRLVREGHVEEARRLLGRDFCLRGPIVRGRGIGSRQTVPTLNLAPDSQVLPADGVYITETLAGSSERHRPSVTNVGLRPTFDGRRRTVETFLLGRVEGAPPDAIELRFLRKIRDERKFPSAETLREQIRADIEAAKRYFARSGAASGDSPANS